MSKRVANTIFKAMNELAEVRHVYQREKPKHGLDARQRRKVLGHLKKAKKSIVALEKEFKKKVRKRT